MGATNASSSISLKPFERDRALKDLMRHYEQSNDFPQFVEALDAFFTENGLYQESDADVVTAEAINAEELRLVCFETLVPG